MHALTPSADPEDDEPTQPADDPDCGSGQGCGGNR
jgi:hypothetical protein